MEVCVNDNLNRQKFISIGLNPESQNHSPANLGSTHIFPTVNAEKKSLIGHCGELNGNRENALCE